jgi:hypothetical protein
MKLGRNYRLTIQNPQNQQFIIKPPFSMQFSCGIDTSTTMNSIELTIWNLGPATRNSLFKDKYDFSQWEFKLEAGYGDALYEVFLGNLYEAYSYKEGVDWKTQLTGHDGIFAMQNGFVAQSVAPNTDPKNLLSQIQASMPNIAKGLFGTPASGVLSVDAEGANLRGKVIFGTARDVLIQETNGKFHIYNGKLNVLSDQDIDPSTQLVLDANQLFTTPRRRDTFLDVSILFLPQARLNIIAVLQSLFEIYNGAYKIMGYHHNVMISESVDGPAETTLNLYAGAGAFTPVRS